MPVVDPGILLRQYGEYMPVALTGLIYTAFFNIFFSILNPLFYIRNIFISAHSPSQRVPSLRLRSRVTQVCNVLELIPGDEATLATV